MGHLHKGSARGPVVPDLERLVYAVYGADDELYVPKRRTGGFFA